MEAGLPDSPRLSRRGPAPAPGIVHLGPGAFFRAFNAVYTEDAMAASGGDWGIVAVSLRSATARDQLEPQGGAYTSISLMPEGPRARVIGSIVEVLVAPEDPGAVLDRMTDPSTRIVSLTITEKGYCHFPSSGELDPEHPDILHDLAEPDSPRSALGFLVEALARRRATGQGPFTVLSCDNLPSNGHLARRVVIAMARLRDEELADWIEREVPFPATMVDRITPATTEDVVARLEETEGYRDPACVQHEPFKQWVIEDRFVAGRPDWAAAGAQMVRDVEAHETMKLRCLNGTHSTLAYLGYLARHETIADAVADPPFARLCEKLWAEEIVPTVPQPEGEDLARYTAALMERYRNPQIRHLTWQIAMDGSQKLPQRILGTVRDARSAGRVPAGLCLAVAAWMRYVGGMDERGQPIDVRDPMADRLKCASDGAESAADKVDALLGFREIFGIDLAGDAAFREAVVDAYETLQEKGAQRAVEAYVA
ncbi:mannitol dehydrogenase family protein [Histidinibacterium aquaticum]|uniref:Mannitol dehydrogenase family protein n=1 Tax=Histidinibacterium aquaticum TaxID=2613962 RepID=A0A5J5GMB0_9RHOB|nr:mannitol dehydrogenase family protein [Histidinibacterium aquaticum]KAA9009399.1 mannitol dehydrogenase family protein [Histidinibacterium aquaticum]